MPDRVRASRRQGKGVSGAFALYALPRRPAHNRESAGAITRRRSFHASPLGLRPASHRPTHDRGSSVRAAAHHRNHPPEGSRRDLRRRHTDLRRRRPPLHDHDDQQPRHARDHLRRWPRPRDIHPDGKFSAVPLEDPSLPSFTGSFTQWGGFNQNGNTVNGTFTFNLRGKGSDGSTVRLHQVEHFNQRPDGTVNEFFHCH